MQKVIKLPRKDKGIVLSAISKLKSAMLPQKGEFEPIRYIALKLYPLLFLLLFLIAYLH
ncbi:MAG: hypothetical protein Q8920_16145 [Bacillota bacterium]|nr:hypothetical protein [Bacillota bacterium]